MKYNICIVDDDSNLIDGIKRSLREKSDEWEISYFISSFEALDFCKKENPDLVISDYKMPGMTGLELFSILETDFPEIKKIILTGQSENEVFQKSNIVCDAYLSKPCSSKELIEAINKIHKKGQ